MAARFEEEFAAFIGAEAALATSSCTAAMQICLATAGIGAGDRVLLSPLTFVSAAHAIHNAGGTPIFADVDPVSLNVIPETLRAAAARAGGGTAILPVHLHGQPCALPGLYALAAEKGWKVIEDAAHALPASAGGTRIGRQPANVGGGVCFSFYATKNLSTIEGGMITGSRALIAEARLWGAHGLDRDAWRRTESRNTWQYDVVRPGFKANMTDLAAAMGLTQLRRLPAMQSRRAEIVRRYRTGLADVAAIELPEPTPDTEHAWHVFVIRVRTEAFAGDPKTVRDRFIAAMFAAGVTCSVHFIPIPTFDFYRRRYGFDPEQYPVALREAQRIVSLPLYTKLSDADVDRVIAAVKSAVEALR